MQVETYEVNEMMEETFEQCEEANRLIDELGLEGQAEIASHDKTKGRTPYREITAEEETVYQTLCPTKCLLSKYKAGPIPLRVLQIAAHANSIGLFEVLEVWDRTSASVKDPVLVGHTKGKYQPNNQTFILARWGDELEPLVVLAKRAAEMLKASVLEKLNAAMAKTTASTDLSFLERAGNSLYMF